MAERNLGKGKEKKSSIVDVQAVPAFARSLGGVPRMRAGWLCSGGGDYSFVYKKTVGVRSVSLSDVSPSEIAVEQRLVCDALYIRHEQDKSRCIFLPKDSAKSFGL